jgi:hypothetical protein
VDPQQTWETLLSAYQRNDWSAVEEMAEALLTWLARGGFPPRLDRTDEPAARLIVRVFCSQALAMVPPFDC